MTVCDDEAIHNPYIMRLTGVKFPSNHFNMLFIHRNDVLASLTGTSQSKNARFNQGYVATAYKIAFMRLVKATTDCGNTDPFVSKKNDIALIKKKLSKTVTLVGLMGAGKSSIGRGLATRLDLPFVDADSAIEEAAGATIPEIFAQHGEAFFRDGERRVIQRLLDERPVVLATGGGAFVDDETREAIKKNSISIWIKADLDLLVKRTSKRNTRPLLNKGNPREILADLIAKRYPFYEEAAIAVESVDGPHERTLTVILKQLAQELT
jgi:shikimate kinase